METAGVIGIWLFIFLMAGLILKGTDLVRRRRHPVRPSSPRPQWMSFFGVPKPGYYYCSVEPIGPPDENGAPYREPQYRGDEQTYRLDLDSQRLRSPVRGGRSWPAIVTAAEFTQLKARGFTVTYGFGPYETDIEAERGIKDWWSND